MQNRSRIYSIWINMRTRVNNPNVPEYKYYGGRGITIDPLWDAFSDFKEWALTNGYSDDLSIERRDVDGNYTPDNCYWANNNIQACNRRKRQKSKHTYIGVRKIHGGKWRAVINVEKKQLQIGCYDTELEAVNARDSYIKLKNLPHKLNFKE